MTSSTLSVPAKTKTYYFNVNETVVADIEVTTQPPSPLTIESRRIDLQYNRGLDDAGFCEIEYYDTDDSKWHRMSGNTIDVYLLNSILVESLFQGEDFVYYTTEMKPKLPENQDNTILTVSGTDKNIGE